VVFLLFGGVAAFKRPKIFPIGHIELKALESPRWTQKRPKTVIFEVEIGLQPNKIERG
jgi:hypothetical protein